MDWRNRDSKKSSGFSATYRANSKGKHLELGFLIKFLKNRYTIGALLVVFIMGSSIFGLKAFNNRRLMVYVDDEPIGYVCDSQDYQQLEELIVKKGIHAADDTTLPSPEGATMMATVLPEAEEGTPGVQYTITNSVRLEPVWQVPEGSPELCISSFLDAVDIEVGAAVVVINGEDVVALANEDVANEIIDLIVESYTSERGGQEVLNYQLQEDVSIEFKPVKAGMVLDRIEALNLLSTGYTSRQIHIVERGESLWSIGMKNGMTVSELKDCNPELESNLLHPGDELAVEPLIPYLHVATQTRLTTYEYISYNTTYQNDSSLYTWQTKTIKSGVNGKNEVVYDIELVNGKEVARTKISTTLISEPVTRIVARGTKIPVATGTGSFIWPVDGGGRISSPFGWTGRRYHHGIDIATPTGTNIFAADAGVVTTSTYSSTYGYYIIIDHGNGYSTLYAHNSKLLVSAGTKVKQGQIIARSGSTGNSTGPHLHFEIRKDGEHQNPMNYFK